MTTKITPAALAYARERVAEGESYTKVAARLGVHRTSLAKSIRSAETAENVPTDEVGNLLAATAGRDVLTAQDEQNLGMVRDRVLANERYLASTDGRLVGTERAVAKINHAVAELSQRLVRLEQLMGSAPEKDRGTVWQRLRHLEHKGEVRWEILTGVRGYLHETSRGRYNEGCTDQYQRVWDRHFTEYYEANSGS